MHFKKFAKFYKKLYFFYFLLIFLFRLIKMNVFKRIAELAQNRFMNTENMRSTNQHLNEDVSNNSIVTPQNVYRISTTFAPQRRINAVTRYVARREQIILTRNPLNNSNEIEEIVSTSTVYAPIPSSNLHSRNQSQRHSYQIQVCKFKKKKKNF